MSTRTRLAVSRGGATPAGCRAAAAFINIASRPERFQARVTTSSSSIFAMSSHSLSNTGQTSNEVSARCPR
jgi:hypothetical protein